MSAVSLARRTALQLLCQYQWDKGAFLEDLLTPALAKIPQAEERALVTQLLNGVVRNCCVLDYCISVYVRRPFRKLDPDLVAILRLAFYQLLFLERVPAYAVLDQAVNQAPAHLKAVVNAVLREHQRHAERASLEHLRGNAGIYLATKHSLPAWLVSHFFNLLESYGYDPQRCADDFFRIFSTPPTLQICVNTKLISVQDFKQHLQEQGLAFQESPQKPECFLELKLRADVGQLLAFQKGWFYIQDRTALRVAQFCQPQQQDRVLDACAAPGGKTWFLASQLQSPSQLTAVDCSAERLERLQHNLERLQLRGVDLQCGDFRAFNPTQPYDMVLVDAPCSNLGVLARRVDARWRLKADTVNDLVPLQRELLQAAYRCLKPGGTLIYSTCTLNRAENEANVAWIQERFPDVQLQEQCAVLPGLAHCPPAIRQHCSEQPSATHVLAVSIGDGGFMAKLCKKSLKTEASV